jgi:hypothetical protein
MCVLAYPDVDLLRLDRHALPHHAANEAHEVDQIARHHAHQRALMPWVVVQQMSGGKEGGRRGWKQYGT